MDKRWASTIGLLLLAVLTGLLVVLALFHVRPSPVSTEPSPLPPLVTTVQTSPSPSESVTPAPSPTSPASSRTPTRAHTTAR